MTLEVPPTPTKSDVTGALAMMAPLRQLIRPRVFGIEHVPPSRALLVGNHNVLGLVDAPLLCAELWERDRMVRALGDHAHFKIPLWRDVMRRYGVIDGTRSATAELMRRNDLIMVFPGGGREVAKRKGERYKLIWKQRLGFARLAIENGYPIVPFASVGAEHGVDILLDADDAVMAPARALLETLTGTPDLPPIVRGIGPTMLPRPERQYYWFGEPIETAHYCGVPADRSARELRERTAAAIEDAIEFLFDVREDDPDRTLLSRLRHLVVPAD